MDIEQLLQWARGATVEGRIEAARILSRAYKSESLSFDAYETVLAGLTYLLEDPCVAVREEIALALSEASGVPRFLLGALIQDVDCVALPILSTSKDLYEAELIDIVASGGRDRSVAIAARAEIEVGLAAAIAEVGCQDACLVLIANARAAITSHSFERIIERFGDSRSVQEVLNNREDLAMPQRHMLIQRYTESLQFHPLVNGDSVSRSSIEVVQDAQDKATLSLAWNADVHELEALIDHLVARGQMNGLLLLRAAVCGCAPLFEGALARLTELPVTRIAQILEDPSSHAVKALLLKACLPERVCGLLQRSLELWQEVSCLVMDHWEKTRVVVTELLEEQRDLLIPELGDLQDLLLRLATETSRESAKRKVADLLAA
ncbi:DUF2336 domain-containing protein [Polycladidibacter stylochi]|uniref:DUF2336 domain-containing protein n=1 Tax=Polycladidibacter stylochi TaxID=1807766 RepID=UPI0008342C90|nr:DUF2336 domain-containing protein [Pseudovibrio stylochi]